MNNLALQDDYSGAVQRDSNFSDQVINQPPRCSTPIFDPCVGSSRMLYLPEEILNTPVAPENRSEYNEWKKRLEHKKSSRKFKVRRATGDNLADVRRGSENGCQSMTNCSIISGYFELNVNLIRERINEETIARPAPVYQMWLPVTNYPTYWNPINYYSNYHQQNYATSFCGIHGIQRTQRIQYNLQPAQFFSIFSNDHQTHNHNHQPVVNKTNNFDSQSHGLTRCHIGCVAKPDNLNNAQPRAVSPPQMLTRHFYYQYPQVTQFMTYFGEPMQNNFHYYNVPSYVGVGHHPLTMNS